MKKTISLVLSIAFLLGVIYLVSPQTWAGTQSLFGQPAVYNATTPTLTNGQAAGLEVDIGGNLKVTTNYLRFSTTTATLAPIKLGAGVIHTLTVSSTTVGTSIGLYDATTTYGGTLGTLIGTTTVGTATGQETYTLDVPFTNGLWIAVTGAAAPIVISYQ